MTHSVTYCCVGGRGGGQGWGGGAEIEGDPIPLLFRPVEISPWRAARGALIFIASLLRKAPKIKIKTSDPDVPPPNPERGGGVGEGAKKIRVSPPRPLTESGKGGGRGGGGGGKKVDSKQELHAVLAPSPKERGG